MTKLSPMQELLRRTMSQTPPMQPDDRLTVDPTPPPELRDNSMFDSPEEADEILAKAKERQARQSQPSSNTATGETPTK
jgi:hypothetical protein